MCSRALFLLLSAHACLAQTNMAGIATGMLDSNPTAMATFCASNLSFWWNWAPSVPISAPPCAVQRYIPMVWGVNPQNVQTAAASAGQLMGYNEPDHWGPASIPGGDVDSAGTFPMDFHCGSAQLATDWQRTVLAFLKSNPNGTVIS